MFKIDKDIPYDPSRRSKHDTTKQSLLNCISILKPGESIFVSTNDLPINATKVYYKKVLQKTYGNKKLVLKDTIVDSTKGVRIWCNPENKL